MKDIILTVSICLNAFQAFMYWVMAFSYVNYKRKHGGGEA